MSLEYLRELIPPTVGERQPYSLRLLGLGHTELRRRAVSDIVDFYNFPRFDYDITILVLWSYWKRWVCDASVMSAKS